MPETDKEIQNAFARQRLDLLLHGGGSVMPGTGAVNVPMDVKVVAGGLPANYLKIKGTRPTAMS